MHQDQFLPNYDELRRHRKYFLDQFPGVQTFQTFDDTPAKRKHLARVFHKYDPLQLEELNDEGAGVFLTINETNGSGRKAKDIMRVRAVFADLDGTPVGPVKQDHPHILIESSPGKFHGYWMTCDLPLSGFRQVQEAIAHKYGSDPKVKDLPRVMRVPGFFWGKDENILHMVRIVSINRRPPLTFRELVELFPPKPVKQWSAKKYTKDNSHQFQQGENYRGSYGAGEGNRNNSLMRIIGGAIKRGLSWPEIESEAHKHGAACMPPLSPREIEHTLKSGRRYL